MNPIREQLAHETAALAVLGAVFLAGLVCLTLFIIKACDRRNRQFPPLSPWRISGFDFSFFIIIILLWFIVAGRIVVEAHAWLFDPDPEAPISTGVKVMAGLLLQSGMLLVFWRFREVHRQLQERPLSERVLTLRQAAGASIFGYLALFPVIALGSAGWIKLLEWLRSRGLDIELTSQDPVVMFNEIENPMWLALLIALTVLIAPIAEEHVFRGGVYRFLRGRMGWIRALAASGLLFAVLHFNLQSMGGLFIIGVGLCLAYEITGNLRVPIFMHAWHNTIQVAILLLMRATNGAG